MAVSKICARTSNKLNARTENDNFEEEPIKPAGTSEDSSTVQKFLILKINFGESFHKMVSLNLSDITDTPATQMLSDESINGLRVEPLILHHPCHNQSIKQHVKLVTEISAAAATFEKCNGIIRQKFIPES